MLSISFSYIQKITQKTPLLIPGRIAPLPIAIPIAQFCKKVIKYTSLKSMYKKQKNSKILF